MALHGLSRLTTELQRLADLTSYANPLLWYEVEVRKVVFRVVICASER